MGSFVTLVAEGGDMTVGRRTAAYVYGAWQVTAPDDVETPEGDDRLQDGYIYRPDDAPTGKFDLAFVRADAAIDMQEGTSDVEQSVDTASRRSSGDVFFERDIAGRGLGRYVPGVDYRTGDIVDVQIWGRRLALPVTAIDMLTGTNGRWRVHVGGQLISDAELLRTQNQQVQEAIDAARRRAAKEAIDASTRQAVAAAQAAADDAQQATEVLGDSLALVEAQQEQIDAEQDERLESQEQMIELLRQVQAALLQTTTVTVVAQGESGNSNGEVAISSGQNATVTAGGTWIGKMIVHGGWHTGGSNDGGSYSMYPSILREFPIPNAGSRTVSIDRPSSSFGPATRMWVRVDYQITPGVQHTRDRTGGQFSVARSSWTTVTTHAWTVPAGATRVSIHFKSGWSGVPFLASYSTRILVNGAVAKQWGPKSRLGPLLGNGYRAFTVSLSEVNIVPGSTVEFQVWTDASNSEERVVRDTETRISWIQNS